jgi:class 3 adenylate cyclase
MSVTSSRTNGFLFADLRDYTQYVERRGDRAAAALLEAYRGLVRGAVADFGGAEIKTEGDSFYVVFPSASSAVQCGLAILEAAATHQRESGTAIPVGIGVQAGETVETEEGYVGSAVNVAARVCSQARAGELLVTDTVRALTRTLLPVSFVDRRTRRLKGISEPVTLYRVVAEDALGAPRAGREAGGSLTGVGRTVRVAVLLIGLLIGGAAAGYLLLAAQRPPGEGSEAGSPSAAPTATFPTDDELDLVQSVPLPIRDSCGRTSGADDRLGTVASLLCDLDIAEAADTVWYDSFETQQQLINTFDHFRHTQRTSFGDCSPTVSRAHGNWGTGSRLAGSLMCFQADGSTWIIWTYTADRILARAVRAGTAPDDWTDLYAWWDTIKLFQR